jgi:hypothetical protein
MIRLKELVAKALLYTAVYSMRGIRRLGYSITIID